MKTKKDSNENEAYRNIYTAVLFVDGSLSPDWSIHCLHQRL